MVALASSVAAAAPAPGPFSYPRYLRLLPGIGAVPLVTGTDTAFTLDGGVHSFDGAFSTGVSGSGAADNHGRFLVGSFGLFVQLDLTYLILSCLWSHPPQPNWPVRLQVGSRIGMDLSVSWAPRPELPRPPDYWLLRPALYSFVDVEVPLGPARAWSLILRGSVDSAVNLGSVYRWCVGVGVGYGWGTP